jgi:hypothetical protein
MALCGPAKLMKSPDAGARFSLSSSCAVAWRGVFAVSSPVLQLSGRTAKREGSAWLTQVPQDWELGVCAKLKDDVL